MKLWHLPVLPWSDKHAAFEGGSEGVRISETYNDVGAELDTLLSDAATKYIMGEITKEDYLAQLEVWKERGGEKIAEEFAAAYEAREGK